MNLENLIASSQRPENEAQYQAVASLGGNLHETYGDLA